MNTLSKLATAVGLLVSTAAEATTTLNVSLAVNYVGPGNGFPNTPNAAYTCGYDKASYDIDQAGEIVVELVNAVDRRFAITSVQIDNDVAGDYDVLSAQDRQAVLYAANETAQTIYFTTYVLDRTLNQTVACDPEVQNEPPAQ